MINNKKILANSFLLIALFFSFSAQAYDKLIIFGDSLSDLGVQNQNPNVPRNKAPTWTNTGGYTWAYYLAQKLNVPLPLPNSTDFDKTRGQNAYVSGTLRGTNYAAGGATTGGVGIKTSYQYNPPSLLEQVRTYTNNIKLETTDPNALYVIWGGANDIGAILEKDLTPERILFLFHDLRLAQTQAITNIKNMISMLHVHGIKNIVVLTVPNVGVTPLFNPRSPLYSSHGLTYQQATEASDTLSLIAYHFANTLTNALQDSRVKVVDIWSLANHVTAVYQGAYTDHLGNTYMIENTVDSACGENVETDEALTCESLPNTEHYIFADGVHYTDLMHQIIADEIFYALN